MRHHPAHRGSAGSERRAHHWSGTGGLQQFGYGGGDRKLLGAGERRWAGHGHDHASITSGVVTRTATAIITVNTPAAGATVTTPNLTFAPASVTIQAGQSVTERNGATGPSAGACTANLDPSQFGSTIIAIQSFSFKPTPVHVMAGSKVTWLNCEPAGTPSHTTAADGGAWGSTPIDPVLTYSFVFPTPGTFAYHCEPHLSMTAQVVVDP